MQTTSFGGENHENIMYLKKFSQHYLARWLRFVGLGIKRAQFSDKSKIPHLCGALKLCNAKF